MNYKLKILPRLLQSQIEKTLFTLKNETGNYPLLNSNGKKTNKNRLRNF